MIYTLPAPMPARAPARGWIILTAALLALAVVWSAHAVEKHINTVKAVNQCTPDRRVMSFFNELTRFDLCKLEDNKWALIVNNGETGWSNKLPRLINYLLNQNITRVLVLNSVLADDVARALSAIP